MATPETRRQLLAAVAACEDKKGEDIRILELDPADSGLADFFLIVSASNDRQVVAIADEIEFRLKKDFGLYATSVEGRRQAEWILLDYIDIVIHVFLAEKRAFYDIERLRKSARNLTGAEIEQELKIALAQKTRAVRKSAPVAAGKTKLNSKASSKPSKGVTPVSAKKAVKKATKPAAVKSTKAAASKAPAKKVPVKAAAKAVKKAAAPAAKKAPAKKAAAKKAPARKVPANKAPAKPAKKPVKKPAKPAPKPTEPMPPPPPPPPPAPVITQGAKPPILK